MKHRIYLIFFGILAGGVNRYQQDIIEYLKEENRIPLFKNTLKILKNV